MNNLTPEQEREGPWVFAKPEEPKTITIELDLNELAKFKLGQDPPDPGYEWKWLRGWLRPCSHGEYISEDNQPPKCIECNKECKFINDWVQVPVDLVVTRVVFDLPNGNKE